jgi:hypothetical protein
MPPRDGRESRRVCQRDRDSPRDDARAGTDDRDHAADKCGACLGRDRPGESGPSCRDDRESVPGDDEEGDAVQSERAARAELLLAASMMACRQRPVPVWSAVHDNAWTTLVTEQPRGTFAAVAFAESHRTVTADYIEDSPETAKAAALDALKAKTGHDLCSPRCAPWESYTHAYEYDDEGSDQ